MTHKEVDQTGTGYESVHPPKRIVSLVPSTTETVFALGAGDRVVGLTRYCVRPSEARIGRRVVGGTKKPRVNDIVSLRPDLVLANREENRREDIEALRRQGVRVFVFYPRNVAEALADVRTLGRLLGVPERGEKLAEAIESKRSALLAGARFRYLYLIWREPFMAAGPDTFIDALLGEAGGDNRAPRGTRYPEMSAEMLRAADAQIVFLSSEPYPFSESDAKEIAPLVAPARVRLVDGQLLSWHGARLIEAFDYLSELVREIGLDARTTSADESSAGTKELRDR